MPATLGYWNLRGLANQIRYMLEYVGEKYDYKFWDQYEAQPKWFSEKQSLGLTFPNLPYYIDGNTKLSQSVAIMHFLARKHGLGPKSEEEMQQCDMVEGALQDLRMGWIQLMYMSQDFEKEKKRFEEDVKKHLDMLSKYLGQKKYLLGNDIKYVDFILFDLLDNHMHFLPNVLKPYQNLADYHKRMMELKGIKDFYSSNQNPKAFNGPMAKWGG